MADTYGDAGEDLRVTTFFAKIIGRDREVEAVEERYTETVKGKWREVTDAAAIRDIVKGWAAQAAE